MDDYYILPYNKEDMEALENMSNKDAIGWLTNLQRKHMDDYIIVDMDSDDTKYSIEEYERHAIQIALNKAKISLEE